MTDPIDTATPMASEEPKPCPFCGSAAKEGYAIHDYNVHSVYCLNCGANVDGFSKPDEAIEAWNRRAKEQSYD